MNEDPLATAKAAIRPSIETKEFRVFVFGPALGPTDVVATPIGGADEHETIVEHARYLRYVTKLELEKEGFTVDYGESAEILKFWNKYYKSDSIGSTEILHAHKLCGAIVIFPSSVGSIAELGLFARDEAIAEKTLAITHDGFTNSNSFFRLGLLDVFETYNGKSSFVNYTNHEACIKAALRFVRRRYNRVMSDLQDIEYKGAKYRGTVFGNES